MTGRDRDAFARFMFGLGEVYGEAISEERMELFFRALSDLSLEAVRAAANVHVRTQKFFPRPSELREAIEGNAEDRAEIAWANVQGLVRRHGYYANPNEIAWPDEATKEAALRLYGGWKALCEHLPAAGPEMLGTAKLFKAHFAAVARQAERGALAPSREEAKRRLSDLRRELEARGLPVPGLTQ